MFALKVFKNRDLRRRIISYTYDDIYDVARKKAWWVLYYRKFKEAFKHAAEHGQLNIVKYLYENQYHCDPIGIRYAANNGHIEIIKFFHGKLVFNEDVMDGAANGGQLEIVKYLHENNEACTTEAMDLAIWGGHLDVVKYLHENRNEGYTAEAVFFTAIHGRHFDVIEYLHKNRRAPCTTDAMDTFKRLKRRKIQTT
eukprot:Pgem_evm1s18551